MKRFLSTKIILIIVAALFLGFADLPAETQKSLVPFTPNFLTEAKINLGLDLQGGSQLDYKINLNKVPEQDQEDVIEGVFEVITKRVNGLGVSEPNIYRSSIGNEEHIIVELAGIKDLEEAKKTVGKTIQLEFKEPKEEIDENEEAEVKWRAEMALERIIAGEDFATVGTEYTQSFPGKVNYREDEEFKVVSSLGNKIKEAIEGYEEGEVVAELLNNENAYTVNAHGQLVPDSSLLILKILERKEEIKYEKELEISNILITYKGSNGANPETVFTKEEARAKINEVRGKALAGEDWNELVKFHSDDGNTIESAGKIDEVINKDSAFTPALRDAALEQLDKVGDISEVVESPFGFHILRANDVRKDVNVVSVRLGRITFSTLPDEWKDTGLTGEHFVHADLEFDSLGNPVVSIIFNDEGAQLFEDITARLAPQRQRLAIFVGGVQISAPAVNAKISGGQAQITNIGSFEEARELARDLNTGAIPAPIILTGQNTIGAVLGATSLQQSLWAGILGLLVLGLYMILTYRFPGLLAVAALAIYSIILLFLIKINLHIGVAISIAVIVFFFIVRAILNSKDSGLEKMLSLLLSVFVLFFLSSLLNAPVVLTLAGVAGVILSIGMAVDANILIFERMKEELREGHDLKASIETGFERAWTSIRDSNFSSLITCAILFYFGSSIIRGFAINLAAGILISMFSAITLTRSFLLASANTKLAKNKWLFGVAKKKEPFKIIEKSKIWFSFSGILVAVALFFFVGHGIKLGIDFTGGTFMEMQFSQEVTKEDLGKALEEIEADINSGKVKIKDLTGEAAASSEEEPALEASTDETSLSAVEIDLKTAQILETGEANTYFVKTKYIDTAEHDTIIDELKKRFGDFEEPRFTTVGPVVGKILKQKAVVALGFTLVMIILYIAFAFRKVPKSVSPWRFGACAIFALIHDVIITLGIFSVLGLVLGVEVDALFITALLTILGFSVHDTIVVFDRLRENLKYQNSDEDLTKVANKSLTQTMARSINTSVSTLITLLALLIWGSPSIFYFTLALVIGVIAGTYSSIFTASPILVAWSKRKKK